MICVAVAVVCAVLAYKPFQHGLNFNVSPPEDSASGLAEFEYKKYFKEDTVSVVVHVQSRDGSPLVNYSTTNFSWPGNDSWPVPSHHVEDVPLADAAAAVSRAVNRSLQSITGKRVGQCSTSLLSYWDVPAKLRWVARPELFNGQLFAKNLSHALIIAKVSSCMLAGRDGAADSFPVKSGCVATANPACTPISTLVNALEDYARSGDYSPELIVEVVSMDEVFAAALGGIDSTMVVSTATAPIAFALLAAVLRNARLLLIPLVNILACLSCTIVIMFIVSKAWPVSSQAPALIVASGLAMNIDYSLFLLTRFNTEVHDRARPLEEAIVTMLETSGHTVLVSGLTLTLCFLGMLLVPVSTIASMGVAAACTVFLAIMAALIVTPTLLLSCPKFFTASRRYGLTTDDLCGCCGSGSSPPPKPTTTMNDPLLLTGTSLALGIATPGSSSGSIVAPAPWAPASNNSPAESAVGRLTGQSVDLDDTDGSTNGNGNGNGQGNASRAGPCGVYRRRGFWGAVGSALQHPVLAVIALGVLGGIAVPFAIPLTKLEYTEGLTALLPRGGSTTSSFLSLQENFGISNVFPADIVVVPPSHHDVSNPDYLQTVCKAMKRIADNVTRAMAAEGVDYQMQHSDFMGLPIAGGYCLNNVVEALEDAPGEKAFEELNTLIAMFGNTEHTATKVQVTTTLDPFSSTGRQWIKAMRAAIAYEVNGGALGRMFLYGMAMTQMDGSSETFASLPLVVGATLAIVCVVLFVAFRSVIVPLRAVLCLVWMLAVTFGSAVLIYQDGTLESLGISNFAPTDGALFWMSPCIAFSIVVGLGLDYDIFLMESVIEAYDAGASPKEAIVVALQSTGNIICLAGIIMTLAFGALLVGDSAALNQIGYLLVVGVLIDCFITTKFVIPAAMALLPCNLNFWPRSRSGPAAEEQISLDAS
eukprot:CAMPEP_0174732880 /NCGR_PEP_ID=MMETSP1094-20130205/60174_1 /TAXON_ID=156173 /ORGANISM="Chrysochromulina brevifilum, Strain UTEX LB 985" /LENGTH=929 /DNA_ID=CAMNT_0015935441 /DNA_START=140 /DNA_END=2929 /DNA_ORIENTATION=-